MVVHVHFLISGTHSNFSYLDSSFRYAKRSRLVLCRLFSSKSFGDLRRALLFGMPAQAYVRDTAFPVPTGSLLDYSLRGINGCMAAVAALGLLPLRKCPTTADDIAMYTGFSQRKLLVVLAIAVAGCCDESRLPQAMRGLYSSEARERNEALQVLAQCGSKGESSVPRIAALMYDKNVGVASSAAYALRKIDSKEARAALKTAEDARARRGAQ